MGGLEGSSQQKRGTASTSFGARCREPNPTLTWRDEKTRLRLSLKLGHQEGVGVTGDLLKFVIMLFFFFSISQALN